MNMNEDNQHEGEDDDDFEVEVVDDTPEEDRGKKRRSEPKGDEGDETSGADDDDDDREGGDHPDGDDDDDEREQYSARVQKRIKKLKYDYHEERRQREAALREREEALRYAQNLQQQYDQLNKRYNDGEGLLYQQAEGRVDAMIKAAQRDLKDAYDTGESDKIVEAQTALSNLVAEKQRIQGYRPRQKSSDEQNRQQPQQPQQQQPQQQPQRPQPSERAKKWAERNDWFNSDQKMTAVAYAIHQDLIENRGVQPDTQEYYGLIDKEMRKTFPSYFKKDEDDPDHVVAAPSRSSGKKPRNVRLTKSQVRIANQLGVPLKEYARQLMLNQDGGKNG